jgi:hypothetical protein
MSASEADIAALYDKLSPEVRPLMEALRDVVTELLPGTTERVHLGWSAINYLQGTSVRDFIVALSPQRAYVNLEFADGVDLPDPAHRLEGTGKRLRHVKIRKPEDAQDTAVRTLLEAARLKRGL